MNHEKEAKEDLGDRLCKYCPLEKKGVYGVPGGFVAGCEGSKCNEAYDNYLEEINNLSYEKEAQQAVECYYEIICDGTSPLASKVALYTKAKRYAIKHYETMMQEFENLATICVNLADIQNISEKINDFKAIIEIIERM